MLNENMRKADRGPRSLAEMLLSDAVKTRLRRASITALKFVRA